MKNEPMRKSARHLGLLRLSFVSFLMVGCGVGGPPLDEEEIDLAPQQGSSGLAIAPQAASAIAPFFPTMAWHQGNKDGFHPDQLSLLQSQPYQFVVIPKMHRQNIETSYYTSLTNAVTQLQAYQSNILGYFNAHYYCSRYAIAGYNAANFSAANNQTGQCGRTFNANNAAAHNYVDAALQKIKNDGAKGIYIDFSWDSSGLGILTPYILNKAAQLFPNNVIVNIKSQSNAQLVDSHFTGSQWYAHIEEVGPDNFFSCSQRPEMCSVNTVDTLGWNVWNLTTNSAGIVFTSQVCSETDSSTWGGISAYQQPGRICNDPTGCTFECNAGYCCANTGPGGALQCGTASSSCAGE